MSVFLAQPRRYNLGRQLQRRYTFLSNLDRGWDDLRVPFQPGRPLAHVMDAVVARLHARKLRNVTLFRGTPATADEASLVVEERTGPVSRCWVVIYAVRGGTEVVLELVRGAPGQPLHPSTMAAVLKGLAGWIVIAIGIGAVLAMTVLPYAPYVLPGLWLIGVVTTTARKLLSKPPKLGDRVSAHQDRLMMSCKLAVQEAL